MYIQLYSQALCSKSGITIKVPIINHLPHTCHTIYCYHCYLTMFTYTRTLYMYEATTLCCRRIDSLSLYMSYTCDCTWSPATLTDTSTSTSTSIMLKFLHVFRLVLALVLRQALQASQLF